MGVLRSAARLAIVALAGCTAITGVDALTTDDDPRTELPDGGRLDPAGDASVPDGRRETTPDDAASDAPLDAGGPCDEPGLVAYWRFDEGSGDTIADCTSNALAGKMEAGAWIAGKKGGALSFDGGFVSFGSPAKLSGTGALTVMAWIREAKVDSGLTQYIVGKTSAAGVRGWRLGTEPPAFSMSTSGEGGVETTGGTVPEGTWVHVAAVFQPGVAVELYVDGARVVRNTNSRSTALVASTDELRIGTRSDGTFPFIGAIDDVRIYDRALSEAEIAARAQP